MPTSSKTSKKDTEIFKQLKALDARDPSIIPEWLIEIKKDSTATTVINPLTDKEISTTAPSGVYNSIIKWCMETYKGEKFDNIPNAQKFATATASAATAAAATATPAAAAKPSSPDFDVILIAEEWEKNPTKDPFNGEKIDVSINPKSKYVVLYQKIMNKLVKHILKKTPRDGDVLTVDECKNIQYSLPRGSASLPVLAGMRAGSNKIQYDYLFIKYFIHSKEIKYDDNFKRNTHININMEIYNSHGEYKNGDTLDTLFKFFVSNIWTSQFSLTKLIINLCYDIKNIIYLHQSKITEEAINRFTNTRLTLIYCKRIYEESLYNNDRLKQEIQKYLYNKNEIDDLLYQDDIHYYNPQPNTPRVRFDEKHYIYYIYKKFADHTITDNTIYQTLISICDCILILYRDNNTKDSPYNYIKDPYNIYGQEPLMPIKPSLLTELQLYKIRLNNLKNAVKDAEKDMEKVGKKPLLSIGNRKFKSEDNIIKPRGVSMLKYSVKSKAFTSMNNEDIEEAIKLKKGKRELIDNFHLKNLKIFENDKENKLKKDQLKIYDKKIEKWNEQLKKYKEKMDKYEKKKYNFDRLPLYEKKKKGKNPLLSLYAYEKLGPRKFKSEDNIGRPRPIISSVKYSPELKAFISLKKNEKKPLLSLYAYEKLGPRKFKSEDNIGRPRPIISSVKYYDELKANSSVSNMSKLSPYNVDNVNYINDTDPYTQESFDEDMNPIKLKYVSDIVSRVEGKVHHYRFDTVSIYNYILKCKQTCIKPINFYTKKELTNENFHEICNKIKKLSKYPTYSSTDLIEAFKKCKYNNMIVLDYDMVTDPANRYNPKEIKGYLPVYLHINLGGILFRAINKIDSPASITTYDNYPNLTNSLSSQVLKLPYFDRYFTGQDIYDRFPQDSIFPEVIVHTLNTILSDGGLIVKKYFPYRKNNNDGNEWNAILNLPEFKFTLDDTVQETLDKLTTYKDIIQRL